MIDICMALDQSVSPHTGVRTIQNTGVFWQVVFQPLRPTPFFWNTAPPPKLQSRTHTTPPATQASAGVIRCSHKFHNHLLCLLPLPVLYPLTVFSKSKSSSSFTSKHGPYVSSKTEIVKSARKIRRAKRRMRLNGSR